MIVDRVHRVAATVLSCGGCRREIALDEPYGEVQIAGVREARTRCQDCITRMRKDTAVHDAEVAARAAALDAGAR